jgi:hypothetical protein
MRRGFIGGGENRPPLVRITAAIVNVEIIPHAARQDFRSVFPMGFDFRNQTLDVVPGCPPQRAGHEIDKRFDLIRKAATDLLMNAEDNAVGRRIDEPGPQNIADAARQYKIVAPLAFA